MILELLISIIIIGILLWLFYKYLEWCDKYSFAKLLYNNNPELLSETEKSTISQYGKFMLPEYLSDTFKPIRFWLIYYKVKLL